MRVASTGTIVLPICNLVDAKKETSRNFLLVVLFLFQRVRKIFVTIQECLGKLIDLHRFILGATELDVALNQIMRSGGVVELIVLYVYGEAVCQKVVRSKP